MNKLPADSTAEILLGARAAALHGHRTPPSAHSEIPYLHTGMEEGRGYYSERELHSHVSESSSQIFSDVPKIDEYATKPFSWSDEDKFSFSLLRVKPTSVLVTSAHETDPNAQAASTAHVPLSNDVPRHVAQASTSNYSELFESGLMPFLRFQWLRLRRELGSKEAEEEINAIIAAGGMPIR